MSVMRTFATEFYYRNESIDFEQLPEGPYKEQQRLRDDLETAKYIPRPDHPDEYIRTYLVRIEPLREITEDEFALENAQRKYYERQRTRRFKEYLASRGVSDNTDPVHITQVLEEMAAFECLPVAEKLAYYREQGITGEPDGIW
jgi:hypothetical protein